MCHPTHNRPLMTEETYDFTPTFPLCQKIFARADLVVGNLETLVSKRPAAVQRSINYERQTRPYLNAPDNFLDALSYAGFDVLITANNHVCDGGETGIQETLDALDAHGFAHTGSFPTEKRYVLAKADDIKGRHSRVRNVF